MAENLGTLGSAFVDIVADTSKVQNQLTSIQGMFSEAAASMGMTTNELGTKLVAGIGKGLLAAGDLLIGGIGMMAVTAANYGDVLDEASEKTGITVEQLAQLKFAAEQSDASFEDLTMGLRFLSKNLFEAATNAEGKMARAFTALGVDAKAAADGTIPLSDVLLHIADKFKTLPSGATESGLAIRLFGRSGQEMIPLLNQGSEGIQRLGAEFVRMTGGADTAKAKLGDEFINATDRTKTAVEGLKVSIGDQFVPALTDLVNVGNEAIIWTGSMARAFPGVTMGVAGLGIGLTGAGGLLIGLATLGAVAPKVSLGLEMIGGSAGLLKGGLIGLAIGGVAYLTFELSKLWATGINHDSWSSSLRAAVLTASGPFFGLGVAVTGFRDSWETLTGSSSSMDAALGGVNNRLTEYNTAQSRAAAATAQTGTESSKLDEEMRKLLDSMSKENTEAARLRKELEQLQATFQASLKPADDLQATIDKLGNVSKSDIVKVYRDQLIEATEKQMGFNIPIKESTSLLYALALGAREAAGEVALVAAPINDILLPKFRPLESAPISDTLPKSTNVFAEMGRQSIATAAEIQRLEDNLLRLAGTPAPLIMELLGSEIERVRNIALEAHLPLGTMTQGILNQAEATARLQQRSTDLQNAWGSAITNMRTSTSREVADMVVDMDFQFSGLIDIGKNTAKSMLGSFIDGFISPFTDRLENLGRDAAKEVADIFFGTGGPKTSGPSGGLNLGGLFGGGNKAPDLSQGITLPDGTVLMSAAGGGGGGGLGSLFSGGAGGIGGFMSSAGGAALISGGIQIGMEAAKEVGAGRDAANEIVKSQEPFGEAIKKILENQNLTGTSKLSLINADWDEFQANIRAFAGDNAHNMIVMNQAFATLQPWISQIRQDLQPWVDKETAALEAASPEGLAAASTQLFSDAVGRFDGIAARMEASMGAVGLGGTIQVNLSPTIVNTFELPDGSDPLIVRDKVMPEITQVLITGIRGFREQWTQLFRDTQQGVTATAIPTTA